MTANPEIPPGWNYNPSDWAQRVPIAALAAVGFCVASYLALFQLGIIDRVWDPFFGAGTRTILTSPVSDLLPIPDALLGALGYLLDAVAGVVGGTGRWRSSPWIVLVFGLAVGPLGAISVLLVISQPVLFHAWCSLCLLSALISLLMIGPAMDEVLASLQHVKRELAAGRSWWRVLIAVNGEDSHQDRTSRPAPHSSSSPRTPQPGATHSGTGHPMLFRIVTAALGAWLMAAPAVLGYRGIASVHDRIAGPLVVSFAIIAISQVTRPVRRVNTVLGAWLLLAPWILSYPSIPLANSMIVGGAVIVLSLLGGAVSERFGDGWSGLWKSNGG